MGLKTVEELYEQARSAGLSHSTATQASELSRDTLVSSRLSGLWPQMPPPPLRVGRYVGPAPTLDSVYWLRKLAMGLQCSGAIAGLAKDDQPQVANFRTQVADTDEFGQPMWTWSDTGCIALNLELLHVGGTRSYTTAWVPIEACIAHDTDWVLKKILVHMCAPQVLRVTTTLKTETDLRHVSA